MTAPDIVKNLVERFEQHRDSYRSGRYNETQLRRGFLNPFFEALGWDVFNRLGYAEMYKDVIHEDSLEIEGENEAPDYAFRIGGTRKFFIAKRIFQGFKTGADPVFILEDRDNGRFYSNALKKEIAIENTLLRPLYKSGEMKRYTLRRNSRHVIFPYRDGRLTDWNEISTKAPKTAEYLMSCKELLAHRENGRWVGSQWYCYSRNQALEIISSPKTLTADLNPFANYCYDESGEACFPGGAADGYGIVFEKNMYLYVLGLLNSKAVDYYHNTISTNFRGGWFGYDAKIIRNIPIRPSTSLTLPTKRGTTRWCHWSRECLP